VVLPKTEPYIRDAHGEFALGVHLEVGLLLARFQIEHVHLSRVASRRDVLAVWREAHRPRVR